MSTPLCGPRGIGPFGKAGCGFGIDTGQRAAMVARVFSQQFRHAARPAANLDDVAGLGFIETRQYQAGKFGHGMDQRIDHAGVSFGRVSGRAAAGTPWACSPRPILQPLRPDQHGCRRIGAFQDARRARLHKHAASSAAIAR
ncbi:hypothetical protein [Qipengyuania sp. ASV99]|uniref:hypothetical protein n=1 Tax=Qipengyuania sp. ASV99 TaxID=3399681 RepID=UPI003A4C58DF